MEMLWEIKWRVHDLCNNHYVIPWTTNFNSFSATDVLAKIKEWTNGQKYHCDCDLISVEIPYTELDVMEKILFVYQ